MMIQIDDVKIDESMLNNDTLVEALEKIIRVKRLNKKIFENISKIFND